MCVGERREGTKRLLCAAVATACPCVPRVLHPPKCELCVAYRLPPIHVLPASTHVPQKYRYRLVVDESMALGVLGRRGRGAVEHFGYGAEQVEIVAGSIGEPLL